MKTQILLTVEDAGLYTKMTSSLFWFVEVFKKAKMNVWIDDPDSAPITLQAREESYEIPVSPGEHILYFEDTKRASRERLRSFSKALTFGTIGASIGLASGSFGDLSGAILGAAALGGGQRVKVQGNILSCVLAEGDELAVKVKPKSKKVKITVGL